MEALALYLFRSSVWLTGFALVYALFLRNERFFTLNRIYLVSGILVSIIFPLYTWHYTVLLPFVPSIEVSEPQMQGIVAPEESFNQESLLLYGYVAGILFLVFRILRQTLPVFSIIKKSETHPYRSVRLIRTDAYPASFSFFSFVFVNPSIDEIETNEIVNHELEHIRQQHWIDLLLFEILRTMQWFNPVSWLYGHLIRQNHEYLADEHALQRSSNPAIYRAALLNQMFGGPVISLANSFNYSLNKKRFNMMKHTIKSPLRKLKLLLVLPLMAGILYAFATPEYKFIGGLENQSPQKSLYTIAKDKIDIPFTTQLQKSDLDAVKADLDKLGMKIDYTLLKFTEAGNLKQISASIKYPDGTGVSVASGELTTTDYPEFKMEPNGLFGFYFKTSVKGTVLKPDGSPLPRVAVVINSPNLSLGTVTDENGEFKLRKVPFDSEIVFSCEGFETQKVSTDFDKDMVITMKTAVATAIEINSPPPPANFIQLDNTKDESNITSNTEVLKVQSSSPLKFGNSDGSGKQPLIIKDGVIVDGKNVNNIPPETIESIQVLKGEQATKIYGNKGRNGVMLITSKKETSTTQNGTIDVQVNGYANDQKANSKNESNVYTFVEEMPSFPGGIEALNAFINANLKYPSIALEKGIQGRVYVSFVVGKDGEIKNVKVSRNVDSSVDQEAMRIVKSMPNWKPGKQNGEMVEVAYTIPINFTFPADYHPKSKEKLRTKTDYKIGNINWVNNTIYSSAKLNEVLGMKEGEEYSKEKVKERLLGEVASLYLDNGYLFYNAQITEIPKNDGTIDLNFTFYEGNRFKIGLIEIKGNKIVSKKDILDKITIKPGDVFSKTKIIQSVRAVATIDKLDSEKINPDITPIIAKTIFGSNIVNIVFNVTEK